MSFDNERPVRPVRPVEVPRRRSPLAVTAVAVSILVIGVLITANVWTEVVWYQHLGYWEVLRTEWVTRLGLFGLFGFIAGFAVWLSLWLAKRVRPARTSKRTPLDQYREQVQPLERVVMVVLPLIVGLVAGSSMSAQWQSFLMWWHQEPFGREDPVFGFDASFYVFTLPVLRSLVAFYLTITILCTVLAAFVHLLYGGIAGGSRNFVATSSARIQLAILGLLVMLGIAANYYLDRFGLLTRQGERFYGASYADINAVLPSRGILVGIAIIVGLLFLAVIWRGDWRIPATGVALMVLSAIVIGGIYPSVVQRFQVNPNAQTLEAPFIQRNIDATLFAYGLEEIERIPYIATTQANAEALRGDAETTAQIRLLDPNIVSPTFQQLQQNKQYYNFADRLAVDRYRIDGELRDTVIAVRELDLNGLGPENRNWVNDHTVFTHGFGVVAAYGNRFQGDGQPAFYHGGIPPRGELPDFEPRIYFGRTSPEYSIVGAPEGHPDAPWELDFPDDDSPIGQVNTTYTGDGGPSIGSTWAKLMFAVKFGTEQILFSDRVTEESQILFHRDPLERVTRVAPYLELDRTTYPAVVDGRVVWIVDGYTVTDDYPYAAAISTSGVFHSSRTALQPLTLNYVRNSVKATVDAYDGSVTLYAWDVNDPVLKTWMNVYPASVRPLEEISGDLMSHLRYPEDMFTVQRFQLQRYHVTDAASFYSGQDFWRTPADPTNEQRDQPPYFLTLQMPGQVDPTFSLTSTFIPGGREGRNILTGFLAVNSETGDTPGAVHPDYGTLRLLELPRTTTIPGPGQVQNIFNSNPEAQNILNLLRQGESDTVNGNLLTVPVGGGLLYVQPVYVQSREGTRVPLLRRVFVAFGDSVGFAETLQEALDQVFGEGATPDLGDPIVDTPPDVVTDPLDPSPQPTTEPVEPSPQPTIGPPSSEAQADLRAALERARQALIDGQAALAEGDFAAYGAAQDRLAAALEDAIEAEERMGN